ncbi:unnamed protein product [Hermetia illucens]|uniref:Integrator complex subunit 12 n=1 Tax=Hermetia illucens TaxID=343691 RepID=A0A7R8YVC0_HERIL|nr:integrator complex subunit 12-like [Hermetia illucens]CAD7083669.1 unnamed protein product [Hermetia illucens]
MSATMEVDPTIKQALKFLHSPSPDSAEKIRLTLDEIIKQRYGSRKMLINVLSKKYLEEESHSPGTIKRRKSDERATSSTKSLSSATPSQEIVTTSSEPVSISIGDGGSDEENLKEFGDLACVICGVMVVKAGNRLIECAECHSLYHQECHKPHISDDDANEQEYSWCCSDCKNKLMMTKTPTTTSSPEKSSSSSSSYEKHYSKSYEHSSSSSKNKSSSSKLSSSSGSKSPFSNLLSASTSSSGIGSSSSSKSSSSSSSVTPNINIISADQRLQIMKKKAAKQLESKRKQK